MKPIIFLDVDGVINAEPKPNKRHRYKHTTILRLPIWYHPEVVDYFNSLNVSERVKIYWLTSWGEQANTHLGTELGLDSFPVIPEGEGSERHFDDDWWKIVSIKKFLYSLDNNGMNQPWIWIDDEIRRNHRRILGGFPLGKTMSVEPKAAFGEGYMEALEAFLKKHSAEADNN